MSKMDDFGPQFSRGEVDEIRQIVDMHVEIALNSEHVAAIS